MAHRHVMEHAKARVVIEDGKVVEVGKPLIDWCPLHERMHGKGTTHSREFIRKHVERKISSVGMFTEHRVVESEEDLVPFGASEMLMVARREGLIDCAVLVCDCAGTVIATAPELIQGIGGLMAGLVSTSPLKQVIERLLSAGAVVLDPIHAAIDQAGGVGKAFELGYQNVAVTVAGPEAHLLPELRDAEKKWGGSLLILVIHTSGVDGSTAGLMALHGDLVWACASNCVWDVVGRKAVLQVGLGIPVFALTNRGEAVIAARIANMEQRVSVYSEDLPRVVERRRPRPLI